MIQLILSNMHRSECSVNFYMIHTVSNTNMKISQALNMFLHHFQ